ncbi:hypothetical protein DZC78_10910 [Olleya aquimaris]|nr:hypothetical protein DZC78_10910 [Olleya aquimaris]
MKNFTKHLLVLAIVFATLSSTATEMETLFNKEDGKTLLMFDNVNEGDQLLVKDAFGLILYKEAIKTSGEYNKSFDLTTLPNGNYIFELDKNYQIRIYPFIVEANKVTFNKKQLSVINKPKVSSDNHTIYITAFNAEKSDYSIEILYKDSETIYSETIKNTTSIGKRFKLLEDKDDDYKVVITANDRTFTYDVNL